MEDKILKEMATLATLEDGYGFIIIIHTNDHNPPHMHLYKSKEDIKTENYYTRVLIPDFEPYKIKDIQTYDGDMELTNSEKKLILKWFIRPNKKNKKLNNFEAATFFWSVYQDENS